MSEQLWMNDAACKGLDTNAIFFPNTEEEENENKKICFESNCPVINQCLEFALATRQYGIWGGTTETNRKTIKRKRRRNYNGSRSRKNDEPQEKVLVANG